VVGLIAVYVRAFNSNDPAALLLADIFDPGLTAVLFSLLFISLGSTLYGLAQLNDSHANILRTLVRHSVFPLKDRVTLRQDLEQIPIGFDIFGFVFNSDLMKQIFFTSIGILVPAVIKFAFPKLF
jgi:hypothetical protein